MDWAKAKNILLVILILLNLFLVINVINVKDTFVITGQYQKNAKQALESAGIIVTGNIPAQHESIGKISYSEPEPENYRPMIQSLTGLTDDSATNPRNGHWEINGKMLALQEDKFIYTDSSGKTVFPVEEDKKLYQALSAWIKDNKISKEPFILDQVKYKNEGILIAEYIQQYKKLPVFNNKITFTIEKDKLIKVEGSLKLFDPISLSKADEIISANIVLLTGKERIKEVVKDIVLGYLQLQEEDLYDTPVWRITFISGEKTYFNAYTGEWLGANQEDS